MSALLMSGILATTVATSFLSGIFGMAGGLILIGVLLVLLPLPEAMALHAITQMSSNGWRGLLWLRFVRWRAAGIFLSGCGLTFLVWTAWRYVPSTPVALILLGASPFVARLAPRDFKPNPESASHGIAYGSSCMALMLLTGVAGPLIDTFFLGGNLKRQEIIATKAVCQIVSHGAKLVYFGGIAAEVSTADPLIAALVVAASMIGTIAARPILERLTELQYRKWANHMITAIAVVYLARGSFLLLGG